MRKENVLKMKLGEQHNLLTKSIFQNGSLAFGIVRLQCKTVGSKDHTFGLSFC